MVLIVMVQSTMWKDNNYRKLKLRILLHHRKCHLSRASIDHEEKTRHTVLVMNHYKVQLQTLRYYSTRNLLIRPLANIILGAHTVPKMLYRRLDECLRVSVDDTKRQSRCLFVATAHHPRVCLLHQRRKTLFRLLRIG